MSRVAAVRQARRTGGHRTQVDYVWTGRGVAFRFEARCSACGLLVDSAGEGVAWAVAQDHGAKVGEL